MSVRVSPLVKFSAHVGPWIALGGVVLCSAGCVTIDGGPPSQIDGEYAVFANVIAFDEAQLAAYPLETSPVNGTSVWQAVWDVESNAAIDLVIEGQAYRAQAAWDSAVCGHFTAAFSGVFEDSADISRQFTAGGEFTSFGDSLEGELDWSEIWQGEAGESGVWESSVRISGRRVPAGD